MKTGSSRIYSKQDADLEFLKGSTTAVIGYGNQGRAQALNIRDSGFKVIVGNRRDDYQERAQADGFEVCDIPTAVEKAQIILLLIPDEALSSIFDKFIQPHLKSKDVLVFASGFNVAFEQISIPNYVDVILLAPRIIGVGVREHYLNGKGFFCFVGVHQDYSGEAQKKLLALTQAVSGFHKPAIEVTFKQEVVLDLFNEQAFGAAFGQVLLNSISVLLEQGMPPEAVLVEMYMSGEMSYTYQKMLQVGVVKQVALHSPTSQYGAMSRSLRFLRMGLKNKMRKIYEEIYSGDFAEEWKSPISKVKLRMMQIFATKHWIGPIEKQVRKALGLKEVDFDEVPKEINDVLRDSIIQMELDEFKELFDY